jgi:uncharacterized protein (DUF305 family)
VGITIRNTATAMLLSATVLGLAGAVSGCANHAEAAAPGAGESVSYGLPPATTTGAAAASGEPTAPAQANAQHNQADVTFLNSVALLHDQAGQLGSLGAASAINAQLRTLSQTISTERYPASETLANWLAQWGQPAPSASVTQVPGLLTTAQVQQLQGLKGSAFDSALVSDLVANHQAVISAANTEVSSGSNPQAQQVAQNLVTAEQAELNQLNALGLGG